MTKKRQLAFGHAVPDQIARALQSIVSYLWDDERTDYEVRSECDRCGHVFPDLQLLATWVETLKSDPPRCD